MKLLIVSNFYPPARPGGYTQLCHEAADELARRGHELVILTSDHQREDSPRVANVYRELHLAGDLVRYDPFQHFPLGLRREARNRLAVRNVIERHRPDIAFVWGMWAMSHRVPKSVEDLLPGRVVYYICDYWPINEDFDTAYWSSPVRRRLLQAPKSLIGKMALLYLYGKSAQSLEFRHAMCVSQAVKDILIANGLPLKHAKVVHGGTDLKRFSENHRTGRNHDALRLLYAGQLVRHKGVHTVLRAMGHLVRSMGVRHIELQLAGSGNDAYRVELSRLVDELAVSDYVRFVGQVDKRQIPKLYAESDVLLFPSIYEEPLARVLQEAMASGMVVVSTPTGGSAEMMQDGHNALMFAPEDAYALAEHVKRLSGDPALRERLSRAGRETVASRFTQDRMVDEIESYLLGVLAQ